MVGVRWTLFRLIALDGMKRLSLALRSLGCFRLRLGW
jgi:hypothetical protein